MTDKKLYHRLVLRQLSKSYGENIPCDPEFMKFLNVVSKTYTDFDETESFAYNTLKVSSDELINTNKALQNHKDKLELIVKNRTAELELTIQNLKQTKLELIKANKAKTLFLANMSHEVRTPLNAILGYSELLLVNEESVSEESTDYLNKIHTGATDLTSILNSILDISAIESGKISLNEEPINIGVLLKKITEFYSNQQKKSHTILLNVEENFPQEVIIDKTRFSQIIANLITNAIKFGKGLPIHISLSRNKTEILINIRDQGVGIAKDRQKAIFNSFEQADNSIKREYGGTGLGLAITYSLLKLMDGYIYLDSAPNEGSTFYISIPIKINAENVEINKVESNIRLSKQTDFTTLVVEDNEMNQELIKKFFSNLKYNVVVLANGALAVEYVKHSKPDLILMDLHMPVMDGFEATNEIRKKHCINSLPIIALTADAFIEQKEHTLKNGFNDFITKPLELKRLKSILDHYLKKRS
jgi:signal transduction histidine kinase/CheY-like chemotaxis protein